jgi:translation initiation factor 3 subunit M
LFRWIDNVAYLEIVVTTAETKTLHGLLSVFQEGKLEDYDEFVKANGGEEALLKPWGLSSEQCRRHMRILSLCSLAAEHEEIPYPIVAQTLQLSSEDQVESWVIAAASTGLLTAKMDQLQRKIIVERSVVRRFDMEQWKVLQARLNVWKENVGAILHAFKQSQSGSLPQHQA